jgi:hypothetical protein
MGVTKLYKVAIATIIIHFRHFHPDDTRNNDVLGKTIWRSAFKYDPIHSKKLGRKPCICAGYAGLPKTSHEIEVSHDTLVYLMDAARQGLNFKQAEAFPSLESTS